MSISMLTARWKAIQSNRIVKALGPFTLVILISLIFASFTPTFRTLDNALQISLSASVYVVLAMGLSFVLIAGATDLSAGSVVAISGMTCCILIRDYNAPLELGIVVGLLTGVACGLLNGLLATKLGIVPFIATLGTQWIFRGLTNIMGNGQPVSVRNTQEGLADRFYFIGGGRIFNIPVPVYIFVICGIVLSFVLSKTVFGRNLYAVGSNDESARLSGINVFKTKLFAYLICDGMAGLAGVMLAARLVSAQTNAGTGYEFEGIFAAVIGGVSLSGGEGTILGAICGAVFVAILRNGLNLNGINTFWQQVILGVIIVFAVYIDVRRVRNQAADNATSK